MAKNTKQRFVQARLKQTGKEATPEQRAKFRQRFEALAATKEGRTRIAQVIAPKADAKTRAALKKALVPQTKVDTKNIPVVTPVVPPTVTGSSGKSDKLFPNLKKDLLNLQTGSSSTTSTTSTTLPKAVVTPTTLPKIVVTPTTLPNNTTTTTMARNNTSTSTTSTSSTVPKNRLSPPTTVFTNSESSAVVPSAPITPKYVPKKLVYGPQVFYYPEKFRNIQGATKRGKVTPYPNYGATPTTKKTP